MSGKSATPEMWPKADLEGFREGVFQGLMVARKLQRVLPRRGVDAHTVGCGERAKQSRGASRAVTASSIDM